MEFKPGPSDVRGAPQCNRRLPARGAEFAGEFLLDGELLSPLPNAASDVFPNGQRDYEPIPHGGDAPAFPAKRCLFRPRNRLVLLSGNVGLGFLSDIYSQFFFKKWVSLIQSTAYATAAELRQWQ